MSRIHRGTIQAFIDRHSADRCETSSATGSLRRTRSIAACIRHWRQWHSRHARRRERSQRLGIAGSVEQLRNQFARDDVVLRTSKHMHGRGAMLAMTLSGCEVLSSSPDSGPPPCRPFTDVSPARVVFLEIILEIRRRRFQHDARRRRSWAATWVSTKPPIENPRPTNAPGIPRQAGRPASRPQRRGARRACRSQRIFPSLSPRPGQSKASTRSPRQQADATPSASSCDRCFVP